MSGTEGFRQIVAARAGGTCEYCRLVEAATGVTFHIEHVKPVSLGGRTVMGNLALSCPGCNLAKGDRIEGTDNNDQIRLLFDPRDFESTYLGWHLHFILNSKTGLIAPRTPTAEATIRMLRMNSANRVFARKLQIRAGLIG